MKTVHIKYFAVLKDERGLSEESYTTSADNAEELFTELHNKYRFSITNDRLRLAINDNFQSWDSTITDNDRIVFIPPVAGG